MIRISSGPISIHCHKSTPSPSMPKYYWSANCYGWVTDDFYEKLLRFELTFGDFVETTRYCLTRRMPI